MSDNKNPFYVKRATISDADVILRFILKLAEKEQFPYPITVTKPDLEKNLLGGDDSAMAFLAYENETICGFAVIYQTFSTTTGKSGIHLDDLYIEPDFQGKGYGKNFISYFARLAKERGCARFEWWALKTNIPAMNFYRKLGAAQLNELSIFRLDEAGIENLANQ